MVLHTSAETCSRQCLAHPDHIFSPVALVSGILDQIANLTQDGTSLCPASPAAIAGRI
jgi:hypothetical protein